MIKNADGGSSKSPFGRYHPPLFTEFKIVNPNRDPEPNNSRINPTNKSNSP
jgi:hypothetical protein